MYGGKQTRHSMYRCVFRLVINCTFPQTSVLGMGKPKEEASSVGFVLYDETAPGKLVKCHFSIVFRAVAHVI